MINGSEKRNRQLAFEIQNSHVCEKRSNVLFTQRCLIKHSSVCYLSVYFDAVVFVFFFSLFH